MNLQKWEPGLLALEGKDMPCVVCCGRWLRGTDEFSGRSEGTWRRTWDGAGSLIQVDKLEKDKENCEWLQVHSVGQGQE